MPPRLNELLERAEAVQTDWDGHRSCDVLLFLPPHLLLSSGRLPHTAILASYQMLDGCTRESYGADRPVLINGERLLNLSVDDVARWQTDAPLPRPCPLGSPPALDAALASALLVADPQLALTYQELDASSERGGAEADLHYSERMDCRNPGELVQSWNQQVKRSQSDIDLALLRQQLLDMEQECERQFLSSRKAEHKLSWQRRISQQAAAQLHRYGDLLQRLRVIQTRVL